MTSLTYSLFQWIVQVAIACIAAWIIFFTEALFMIPTHRFDPFFLLLFLLIFFIPVEKVAIVVGTLIFLWAQFVSLHIIAAVAIFTFCYGVYYLLRYRAMSEQTIRTFLVLLVLETMIFRFTMAITQSNISMIRSLLIDTGVTMLANIAVGVIAYLLMRALTQTWNRAFLSHSHHL